VADKSSIDEIRRRFDQDVDRFSNLDSGQGSTVDAPLVLELIARAAAATNPGATRALDVGCGAGNYSLKLLDVLPGLEIDLLDLSRPMLDRAVERLRTAGATQVVAYQGDLRQIPLSSERYDVVVAAATLHHLRADVEWEETFRKLHATLKPGGSLWISDLVAHSEPALQALMWTRYGDYLTGLRDEAYRDEVFAYIEREDSPRSLLYQVDLLRSVGFARVEILHKNSVFAAFGAIK
jgi:tRNA (cmo5U34)-methyltransferase